VAAPVDSSESAFGKAPARWAQCTRAWLVLAMSVSACSVAVQNTEPAKQLARESHPSGSVYVGWRLFNDRCAGCHGVDASGPARMPDLLDHVREMGARRFTNLVLTRYDWSRPTAPDGSEEAARTHLVEQILQRKETPFIMPAWQDEPQVSAHVLDLYAYLAARADGAQGPGRPPR
jgi:mono/diheme cytochrome c family protein